jgi:hypothetical protein
MNEEILDRVERLSPETRALFWELEARGEAEEFRVPADELVIDLHRRMLDIPRYEQAEFMDIFRTIAEDAFEEGRRQGERG